jgi:hypothetical protein
VKIKIVLAVIVLIVMLAIIVTPALAGGGQVQGDKGQGETHEEFENGCDEQPCFDVADRPKNGAD